MSNSVGNSNAFRGWSPYSAAVNWIIGGSAAAIRRVTGHSQNEVQNKQQIETDLVPVGKPSSWPGVLPRALLEHISPFLRPMELGRAIRACKHWKDVINTNNLVWNWQTQRLGLNLRPEIQADLIEHESDKVPEAQFDPHLMRLIAQYDDVKIENPKEQFINPQPAIAFGHQEYIDLDIGDPGDVPRLPADIHEILQSPCQFWEGKTVEETHALVFVSPEFTKNGEVVPGTVIDINELVKNSNSSDGVGIDYIYSAVAKEHGKTEIKKGYWALMTKDVIPGSRRKSYAEQEAMVKAKGYEVPSVYEATTVALTEYLRTGKRLFSDQPLTYTRCKETTNGHHLVVGGFAPAGLDVLNGYSGDDVGVAALRKL